MDQASAPLQPYRVLARTYRPQRLSELIGQEALVRTLTNAMRSGRIAHAFLLSGIRGIGKTTTARIIAKGLNCTGADGKGGPTPEPCGVCSSCRSLVEERPMDVIEMDAATRTGIDDIREIVDAVRYAPAASRYKIYIIDEVHMLSEKAFNGLLKTLEEPPPHAKFIFATTEARKLPITVLSRCQRFDLKRVEPDVLEAHLAGIAGREQVAAEPQALSLIARAAEGSVRDALSLLDQAIALSDGPVTGAAVAGMLGLGDRQHLIDLFTAVIGGEASTTLDRFRTLYGLGAEPVAILQDLLEIAHWLSCLKVDRDARSVFAPTPEAVAAGQSLASRLDLAILARAWQVLLKGLDETRAAPDAAGAAEMVLLRLAAMGHLPTPGEMIRILQNRPADTPAAEGTPPVAERASRPAAPAPMARTAPFAPSSAPPARPSPTPPPPAQPRAPLPGQARSGNAAAQAQQSAAWQAPPSAASRGQPAQGGHEPRDFADLVRLLAVHGEPLVASYLKEGAHLIAFQKDRIELRLAEGLPRDISGRLSEALLRLTGRRWLIALSQSRGETTLAEQEAAKRERLLRAAAEEPAIKALLEAFPGAAIVDIRAARPLETQPAAPPASVDEPLEPAGHPAFDGFDDEHVSATDYLDYDPLDESDDDSRMER